MTDFDLESIGALSDTATRGPWRLLPISDALTEIWTEGGRYGSEDPMHVADVRGWGYLTRAKEHGSCGLDPEQAREILKANGDLLLAARHAIPMLLHEIEALRAQVATERAKTERVAGERNAALVYVQTLESLIPAPGDYAFRAQVALAETAEREQRERANQLERRVEALLGDLAACAKTEKP